LLGLRCGTPDGRDDVRHTRRPHDGPRRGHRGERSVGSGGRHPARVGSKMGGSLCRDDDEPVEQRGAAAEVHRTGAGRVERRLHESQPRRNAPAHSRCARGGRDPRRDPFRAQVRVGHVHPFVQPRGPDLCLRKRKPGASSRRPSLPLRHPPATR
jgi:hypothetical protein